MTNETTPALHFQHLRQKAIWAHSGTSFSPEKRADTLIAEFSAELETDLEALKKLGADETQQGQYAAKFESLLVQWLGAKSNCISSMITGPSKFPTRRAERANRGEENAYARFAEWRTKVKAGYKKRQEKQQVADAGGPLAIARKKLENLKARQELMRQVNAAHKKYLKNTASLDTTDLEETYKKLIRTYIPQYSWEPHPFAPYQLTNNNANIKTTAQRVKDLESSEQLQEKTAGESLTFEGGHVEIADDRLRIFHAEKPAPEKIAQLKSEGFKWSPFNKCWQRQITANGKAAVQRVTGVKIN